MNDQNIEVFITCRTFNQKQYIIETLDGFCMQQTDFPFVCSIIDDASKDGEPKVIQKYLEENFNLQDVNMVQNDETDDYIRIFTQHNSNKNCFFVVLFLKYNHYKLAKTTSQYVQEWKGKAKYHAVCEGDDYWIDPLKLQKQVAFLEKHPRHSVCFCAHRMLYNTGDFKEIFRYDKSNENCPMKDIILGGGGFMATNSMLYRRDLYMQYTIWAKGCPVGDLPVMLTLAHNGFVGYIADVMCVYRVSATGSWSASTYSDIKKIRAYVSSMIKMWHQFDTWTNRKYSNIIKIKIRQLKKQKALYEIKNIKDRFLSMLGFKNQVNRML